MSKGIMRVTTTALGGAAAVAVMLRPVIATNPYILSVIILFFDFVVVLFQQTQFKYAGAHVRWSNTFPIEGFCLLGLLETVDKAAPSSSRRLHL